MDYNEIMVENLKIILDGVRQNYDTIADADNALDGKAGAMMGIEIALGVGYLTFVDGCLTLIEFLGMLAMAVSVILLIVVNWPKEYLPPSVFPERKDEYRVMSEEDLLMQSIVDVQRAIDENRGHVSLKSRLYKIALVLLIVSAFLLIL